MAPPKTTRTVAYPRGPMMSKEARKRTPSPGGINKTADHRPSSGTETKTTVAPTLGPMIIRTVAYPRGPMMSKEARKRTPSP